MLEADMNVVFISKRNISLAYKVKKIFWEMNSNVINVDSFSEVFRVMQQLKNIVIVLDSTTLTIPNGFIQILRDCKNDENLSIILITNEEDLQKYKTVNLKNRNQYYVLTEDKLHETLSVLENDLKVNLAKKNIIKLDYIKINDLLNNWLINTGFITKHLGFSLIKEVVMESVIFKGCLPSLNGTIYPIIALNHNTHASSVERNIRNAIFHASLTSQFKKSEFSYLISNGKVSNRVFISYLLDKVLAHVKSKSFS